MLCYQALRADNLDICCSYVYDIFHLPTIHESDKADKMNLTNMIRIIMLVLKGKKYITIQQRNDDTKWREEPETLQCKTVNAYRIISTTSFSWGPGAL